MRILESQQVSILSKQKEKKIKKSYIALRNLILNLKPSELSSELKEHFVTAALVDMDMGDVIISLACAADGTTSLYYSAGGGKIGLGHKYENVRKASLEFLYYSGQLFGSMHTTIRYPLPRNKMHHVHIVTVNGVFSIQLDMDGFDNYSDEIKLLIYYYQNVIKAIGDAKDQT
jgi:hypothetical protein